MDGRPVVRSNWAGSSFLGDNGGWGKVEGNGIGQGREESRREAMSFTGRTGWRQDAAGSGLGIHRSRSRSPSASGVAGVDGARAVST